MTPLRRLLEGISTDVITDIDEAIEKGRSILASSNPNDLDAPLEFGNILFEAFERTKKIEYLNESIDTLRSFLARPLPKFLRYLAHKQLLLSLVARPPNSLVHGMQDKHEIVELLSQILNDASGATSFGSLYLFLYPIALRPHPIS
jgi:hypothetical protein